jgi:hypothetical protein
MDEITRALAHGQAGLDKINAGMSGDLGAAAEYAAIEDATAEPGRQRTSSPAPTRALIIVAAMALVILILVAVG